jgi:antibiotic biosynthesis monooxygenase (ABM) superfamily enzyme
MNSWGLHVKPFGEQGTLMNQTGNSLGLTTKSDEHGATVVITHRVGDAEKHEYERWLAEIVPLSAASPGHLDWHIVRPIAGRTETYTIIIRFDSAENLTAWIQSPDRLQMIATVAPLLIEEDFVIRSGLDFWFAPSGPKAMPPKLWKQYVVTWSAIFPLVFLMSMVVKPILAALGVMPSLAIFTFVLTGVVVFLMVFVVMPRYTKLIEHWLYH